MTALAAVLMAVAFVGGFLAADAFSSGGQSSPAFGPSANTQLLSRVVVTQGDVPPGETVGLIPGGSQVSGETTLDLCNGVYPSEARRTARLQVAAVDSQGNEVLSTEAVVYSSRSVAAQAAAELQSVAANCPAGPVPSPVGEPTVTTRFNPAPDRGWPRVAGVRRLAYDFATTDQSGQSQHGVAAYLFRGRALVAVYFLQPDAPLPAVGGRSTMSGIVQLLSTRLAALPAG